ncbi:uncharacterized protein (DUF305 family) [Homoserinimonas aerilata]|uniref:Uncharacterized protein (DUF305 family) n=1 Tax=Homoserinimonas aerilata TaxID=1162970 RepID=A0A542YL58_9MICO|nr:DUF305 domain-containing protein [Homoserinimonas aerilata]TQL48825.1 uncharacterized protein (DUF305 family) [Homoserinimonas aerilata]
MPDPLEAEIDATEPRRRSWLSTRFVVAIILGATLLVAVAFTVGRASAPVTVDPTTTSAEAGFARDMQTHHLQAVAMSLIVRDETDDPEIRLLAYDIATAQQQQAGQMFAWLEVWGLPQAAPEPSMTWMSRPLLDGSVHDHGGASDAPSHEPGAPMPGLATAEQMATLKTLSGVEAEKYFLELMIAHHQGGVEMAEAVLVRSDERVVTRLAAGMVTVQQKEIDYMNDLLAERS